MVPLLMMMLRLASTGGKRLLPIVREAPPATGPIVPLLVIVLLAPVTTQGAVCAPLSVIVWFDTLMCGHPDWAAAGADAAPATHAATPAEASRPARREAPLGAGAGCGSGQRSG